MRIPPFFTYFGGKWRAAPHYPTPIYGDIIEPFAGSAGYALTYSNHCVTLVEKDPILYHLWKYLITATPLDILSLPLNIPEGGVREMDIPFPAQILIGFWLNKGSAQPCNTPSAWMRTGTHPTSFWGREIRQRISDNIHHIKHWDIILGSYESAPDIKATWFIDPPYQLAGSSYKHSSKGIDFNALGKWCRFRRGQSIVCENSGANWLPFEAFRNIKAAPGKNRSGVSKEVIWVNPFGELVGIL